MDHSECTAAILAELQRIAPEVDVGTLDSRRPLREQVDLDSMDWLNFLIALGQTFHADIPQSVYERMRTVDDLVGYLSQKATSPG